MRAFINCSEPCKAGTFKRFLDRFASCGVSVEKLHVCYAMAENVFGVTQTGIGETARIVPVDADAFARGEVRESAATEKTLQVVSCGRALRGVGVEIVDEGAILPDGRIGEIRLAGDFLFDGYYRLPEQTKAKLREGWYYTADMGFILDGELFVTGRKDDLLIINGRNYYAHEIEAIVNAVPGIIPGRNIAISVDNRATDASVVVILAECQPDVHTTQLRKQILREVQNTLDLAIHSVVSLAPGSLVKTTSGKISRAENRRLYLAGNLQKSP
jgi:acyl-CoA synthetase (AMP-forming)/AMP-acid ligase II